MCCDWPVKKAIVNLLSLKCTSCIKLSLLGALSTASQTLLIKPKLSYVCDDAYPITSSVFTVLVHFSFSSLTCQYRELRFNKVPRDCGNLFVVSSIRYIENLDLTNFWENKQNVRYIKV